MEKNPQSGFGIRDEHLGSYFLELSISFFGWKYLNYLIRDKHPESAALATAATSFLSLSLSSLCCRYTVYNIIIYIHRGCYISWRVKGVDPKRRKQKMLGQLLIYFLYAFSPLHPTQRKWSHILSLLLFLLSAMPGLVSRGCRVGDVSHDIKNLVFFAIIILWYDFPLQARAPCLYDFADSKIRNMKCGIRS